MYVQRTVKNRVELSGIALHSGQYTTVSINPAPENTGIVFIRTDISTRPEIKALWSNVVDTELSTVLGIKGGAKVATVEHLISALKGLDIDNAIIEVSGPELPILDGSSASYVDAIQKAGIIKQNAQGKYIQVIKPVSASIDDKFLYFLPSKDFKITCRVNYKHPFVGLQHIDYKHSDYSYVTNVAKAKTFGFLNEVEKLKEKGLIKGGSFENALVLDDDKVINKNRMSYVDEFVRHKVLDIIGDLGLVGPHRLLAHVVAYKNGHALHNAALAELAERKSYFKVLSEPVEVDEKAFAEQALSILQAIPSF
ncbi:MAG: UDP-3-O-acyl-N-acetylglucosamine deacetylase [Pseudomonadota bacterium]